MSKTIYLDNAASTPLLDETADFYSAQIRQLFGNPHADHEYSHGCRKAIQKAERQVLASVKAPSDVKIVWTSGGTECNNIALRGLDWQDGDEVITSQFEHPAILQPLEEVKKFGVVIHLLKIDKEGKIDLEELRSLVNEKTRLVTLTALQNELGVLTDLEGVRQVLDECKSKALLHTDNVQGFGKRRLSWAKCKFDLMSTAGHKFHGPNSSGALLVNPKVKLKPLIFGASQQNGLRPGTQDPAAIAAYGFAAELNDKKKDEMIGQIQSLNTFCRDGLAKLLDRRGKALDITYFSADDNSPYILSFAIKGFPGAIIMRFLSSMGTFVGVGSACSSQSKEPSKTLTAMGVRKELAFGALRVSFGWQNTEAEVQVFLEQLQQVLKDY